MSRGDNGIDVTVSLTGPEGIPPSFELVDYTIILRFDGESHKLNKTEASFNLTPKFTVELLSTIEETNAELIVQAEYNSRKNGIESMPRPVQLPRYGTWVYNLA